MNRWFGTGRKTSLVVYDGTVTITRRDSLNIKIRDGRRKIKKYAPLVLIRHYMQFTTYSFKQSILPMELFFLVFEFRTGKTEDGGWKMEEWKNCRPKGQNDSKAKGRTPLLRVFTVCELAPSFRYSSV